MNPVRKLLKFLGIVKSRPKALVVNTRIGIIQPTKISIENNTIDKFNKVIVIREGVEVIGNQINWGKIVDEIPYSEERVKAIKQVYEIPIVERKFNSKLGFFEEPEFGSVETLV